MRKIVSLGLLAILFSLFARQVSADIEDCEEVWGEKKGLYGLCIAYWTATNATARESILRNFTRNAGEGGPGMPGLEDYDPCTCWTQDHVDAAIETGSLRSYSCDVTGTSLEVANIFEGNTVTFFAFPTACFFVHPEDGVPPTGYTSEESELTCRAQIHEIIYQATGDECLD